MASKRNTALEIFRGERAGEEKSTGFPYACADDNNFIYRRECCGAASIHFLMKEFVLFFTGSAYAAYCAPDEDSDAGRHQNRRQIIAHPGEVIQNIVHLREPHTKRLRYLRMLNPSKGFPHHGVSGEIIISPCTGIRKRAFSLPKSWIRSPVHFRTSFPFRIGY
jgi:hypothetical protein